MEAMPPIDDDFRYLGTCAKGEMGQCCDATHLACHRVRVPTPNLFTAAATQRSAAVASDTHYRCHVNVNRAHYSPLHMKLNNYGQSGYPHTLALPTSPAMQPPTDILCDPRKDYRPGPTRLHPPGTDSIVDGVGLSSSLKCEFNNENQVYSGETFDVDAFPRPWLQDTSENISNQRQTSIRAEERQTIPIDLSSTLAGEVDATKLSLCSSGHAVSGTHNPFHYPSFDDVTLPTFPYDEFGNVSLENISFDNTTVRFGDWTTPNTLFEAVTPVFNRQSPPIFSNYSWDEADRKLVAIGDIRSAEPGNNFDSFGAGRDFIPPEFSSPGAALSEYPPLPDLGFFPDDQLQRSGDLCMPSQSCYLPDLCFQQERPLAVSGNQDQPHLFRHGGVGAGSSLAGQSLAPPVDSKHLHARSGQRDTSKDELLVRCKGQGMSYKQIKELGGFEEAESTLRGRYRALTKPREARLRKPEWGEREVSGMHILKNNH